MEVMGEALSLRADGPHSPEYTKEVADFLAEAVRVLNYATKGDGLQYPSDVAHVVGALALATERTQQLLQQLSTWLGAEHEAGRIGEWSEGPHQGDGDSALLAARIQLDGVIGANRVLSQRLNAAHSATNVLEGTSRN
jgi:hypothetical protein